MADLGASSWSEIDASNDAVPPDGWPEGMQPSDVNNAARAQMGGEKRWWDRSNATQTTTGTSTAYVLTYAATQSALYDGEETSFVLHAMNGANPTLNRDALGAKILRKYDLATGTYIALVGGEFLANQVLRVRYNLAADRYDVIAAGFAPGDFVTVAGNNDFTGDNDFTGGRATVPTRTLPDNGTDAASTAFVNRMLRSYLAGLGTANNSGTPNSKIDVAAGVCADATNVQVLVLSATTLDCGTIGANGLDTGSLANSTWYSLFVIGKTDGTTALLASTSLSSPAFPSGYTLKRRVACFKTDSSAHILGYTQIGDEFQWAAPPTDINVSNLGTTATLYTLSSPLGIVCAARCRAFGSGSSIQTVVISSTIENDAPPVSPHITISSATGIATAATFSVFTDTSSQVRARASGANCTLTLETYGWIDRRGRDA